MSEPELHLAGAVAAGRIRDDARLLMAAEWAFGPTQARRAELEALDSVMESMTAEQRNQRYQELRAELRRRLGRHL